MYQIVVRRELQGRGIFCTESRNELNYAPTPTPGGTEERPVILGRKLAAKERRSLLEVRNQMTDVIPGHECHVSPTGKGGGTIEGPCMQCPVCYIHGGLVSGNGNYGRAGIALYDDAFCIEEGETQVLTFNAVDTQTQRTGTALGTETFIYGGVFLNVVSVKHDAPEIRDVVLDSILATHAYGARSRHYGRIKNEIVGIAKVERPKLTSWNIAKGITDVNLEGIREMLKERVDGSGTWDTWNDRSLPAREKVIEEAYNHESLQEWIEEVKGYLGGD